MSTVDAPNNNDKAYSRGTFGSLEALWPRHGEKKMGRSVGSPILLHRTVLKVVLALPWEEQPNRPFFWSLDRCRGWFHALGKPPTYGLRCLERRPWWRVQQVRAGTWTCHCGASLSHGMLHHERGSPRQLLLSTGGRSTAHRSSSAASSPMEWGIAEHR
jgi:hypothetical protein